MVLMVPYQEKENPFWGRGNRCIFGGRGAPFGTKDRRKSWMCIAFDGVTYDPYGQLTHK